MTEYLPYFLLFAVLCALLYLYLKRPHENRADKEEQRAANQQIQDPHAWTLQVIKTDGQNIDGSERPQLIETLHPSDVLILQYSPAEKCYEVQNHLHQTLGFLPHNSTDRLRTYQAAGRIGKIRVKTMDATGQRPELVLEIEVKP